VNAGGGGLIHIKAAVPRMKRCSLAQGRRMMPQGEIIYLAGVVIAFVVFAVTILWVDRKTHNFSR
jgi:hypothetical protein